MSAPSIRSSERLSFIHQPLQQSRSKKVNSRTDSAAKKLSEKKRYELKAVDGTRKSEVLLNRHIQRRTFSSNRGLVDNFTKDFRKSLVLKESKCAVAGLVARSSLNCANSYEPTIINFDFFIKKFRFEEDFDKAAQFKKVVQGMLSTCPELLLRIVAEQNGDELFSKLSAEPLEPIVRNLIQICSVVTVFPEFETIVFDLNYDSLGELKHYLEKPISQLGINILRAYVNNVPKEERKTRAWHTLDNIFLRYDQISKICIEKSPISPYENFKIALFIESYIVTVQDIAGLFFSRSFILPRSIILYDGNIVISARYKFSIIREDGESKRICSAALVPLNKLNANPKNVVVAKILPKRLDSEGRARQDIQREWNIMNKFKGMIGFVQGYYFYNVPSKSGNIRYVMEKFDECLFVFIENKLPLEKQISVAEQCLRRLKAMCDMNIMHSNLITENILFRINSAGDVEIAFTGFGHSREIYKGMKGIKPEGTKLYQPPEVVFEDKALDTIEQCMKYDIYQLGLSLDLLLFGPGFGTSDDENITKFKQEEFKNKHDEIIEDRLKLLLADELVRQLSLEERYEMLILKMTRYYPQDRISVDQALQEVCRLVVS